jgi:hypothetical protein
MTRLLLILTLLITACGGSTTGVSGPQLDPLDPANLYPLATGNVWAYDIDTGLEDDLPVLGQTRVVAQEGDRFEVSNNRSDPVIYEVRPEGIYRSQNGSWLLRAPIRLGAEWQAPLGATAHVTSITEEVDTPAGHFDDCVRVEETGGPSGRETATVYCPGVGPVYLEAVMESRLTRQSVRVVVRLRGYMLGDDF